MYRYYEGLIGRVHTENWISNWFGFEIGLFQGCTASTINFDAAFQPILDAVSNSHGNIGYHFKEANLEVPPLVYADEIDFNTSSKSTLSRCRHTNHFGLNFKDLGKSLGSFRLCVGTY